MNRELATCVASIAALASITSAQTLVRSVNGPVASAQYGKACIRIPDQNADGLADLLVGAPGYNGGRGAIYCVSGQYLASGSGALTLWSVAPSVNAGDQFGYALADLGDVTGDGVGDFLVGQPGYDHTSALDSGAVRLVDGSTHLVLSLIHDDTPAIAFGSSMAVCGDIDNDGRNEVVVGAPGPSQFFTQVFVLWGYQLQVSQQNNGVLLMLANPAIQGSGYGFGASLASGFDLDGDGRQEIAIGVPGWDGPGATDGGRVLVLEPNVSFDINGNLVWVTTNMGSYVSTFAGERLGQSVDAKHDYDGDGVVDIVAGAPNFLDAGGRQGGRVVVLSGAKLLAHTPPYELFTLLPDVFSHVAQLYFDTHFGAAVCTSPDLNNDGVGEILVGSPDYFTGFGAARGVMTIFSGASAVPWAHTFGLGDDHLGGSITGAIDDLDNDGFRELVVAGALSDAGGADSGVIKCYRLFPIAPSTYCTGKTSSLGCTPAMSSSGSPSASSLAPFAITASSVINQKSGLLFYSHAPLAAPFQGGTKCVADPVVRTPAQNSGGSASGADCTGTYSLDFNARIQGGVDPSLVAGAEVFAQYWSRDPLSASTTSLSNALRFVINP